MYKKYTPEQRKIAFWSKVAITANDNLCWEWQASKTVFGYGKANDTNGRWKPAHRIAWQMTFGAIPDGLEVCHSCDNPACVNPKHLWLGTHKQNMEDRDKKGRNKKPPIGNGELNGRAKLTADKVKYIRERYAKGDISYRELSREIGIGFSQISRIIRREQWIEVET